MSIPENLGRFETLVEIIVKFRAPDGCPWDRRQTHRSLRENILEECYELLHALDDGDPNKLCEELGDLLMLIVLQIQIASEAGEFRLEDVMKGINAKLVHRHPHVFGTHEIKDAKEMALLWEHLKQEERDPDTSMLAGVPKHMPALSYSEAIQRRAARVGFDWEDVDGIIDKLVEEVREYKQSAGEQRGQEFGDLLFTMVNIARKMEIDSETVLREANQRFYQRFTYMEKVCRQRGANLSDLSFDEQNALWEEAKKRTE